MTASLGAQFDNRSFSNNDGTMNFASDWTEIGEDDGPTQGDVKVHDHDDA